MKHYTQILALVGFVALHPIPAADYSPPKTFRDVGEWKLDPKQWQLTLHFEKTSFLPDDEIILEIALVNTSNSAGISLHNPIPILDYDTSVADATGKQVKLTAEGGKIFQGGSVIGNYHFETVRPSQSTILKVDLTKVFDLSVAGKYTVTVGRHETIYRASKPSKVISSASFRIVPDFQVTPKLR